MKDNLDVKVYEFNEEGISSIELKEYSDYPIVYILHTNQPKKHLAYIGQTVHAKRRMQEHFKNKERRQLEEIMIVAHERFNQSATYNIETNLINYFIADGKYVLQNKSQTVNSQMHDYYDKKYYNHKLFGKLWQFLKADGLVNDDLEVLRNRDVFKLSPYKELSEDQLELKDTILEICERHLETGKKFVFIIEGDAGTGKSVVLSSTFNTLQELAQEKGTPFHKTNNYLLVNHTEMMKTYEKISESLPSLKKKNFQKPTTFINQIDSGKLPEADVAFVDEAHLLLTKEDNYNNFTFENQLEEIIKRSKVTIAVFDQKQVLKLKSYWNEEKLKAIKEDYRHETFHLTTQFRMRASDEVVEWIDRFVAKKLLPVPQHQQNDSHEPFELRVFADAAEMHQAIQARDEEVGLARLVSTFDYVHKKDGADYFVEEGELKLPWNRTKYKETWAEHPETINEVGSIYTIQGFDLNYVGVILGPAISYDERTDRITVDISKYKDTEAFRKRADLTVGDQEEVKEEIILNSINILMKRGVHGLYVYASDDKLRKKMLELAESSSI